MNGANNNIPLGAAQVQQESTTTLTFERKFPQGTLVSGMYFSGIAGAVAADVNGLPYYMVTVQDKDPRIDGKTVPMWEYELSHGSEPTFDKMKREIENPASSIDRERTFGECAVDLDLGRKGIDSYDDVFMFKRMCADLIDQVKIKIGENEKESMVKLPVDKIIPSYVMAAHYNVRDQLNVAIDKIVKLKHRLVSAVIGNNDKIS